MKKRKRDEEGGGGSKEKDMDIVWQTPANPPEMNDYIFRNGRRHVKPYYFEFVCHVKNRWNGKTIVDLFAKEFKGRPYDYYVGAVKSGRIQVDGETVPVSYVVKTSQKISHFVHRHEPPVMACNISVLQEEPDVVTISKPATVPIEAGLVLKQYVARVVGVFPEDEQVVDVNISYNAREGWSTAEVGDLSGTTPAKGKHACTKFTRISTNGTHSIVRCEPITGRTHQIRVHLQYAGHPIANDFLYLNKQETNRGYDGMSAERAARRSSAESNTGSEYESNFTEDFEIDPLCTNCPGLMPKGYDGYKEEGLWLHCVQYSGPEWVYQCPYPDWATL
ncbi:RNA pseudouridine synthase 7 [Linum grandiflorum]